MIIIFIPGFNAQRIGTGKTHDKVIEVNNLIKMYWFDIICALVEFVMERRRARVKL